VADLIDEIARDLQAGADGDAATVAVGLAAAQLRVENADVGQAIVAGTPEERADEQAATQS
jgi:hypothetical protein